MTEILSAITGVFLLLIGLGYAVIITLISAFMDVLDGIKKWVK